MRRVVPVIAVVVMALAAGCSGGTEEVTGESSNRATTTTRDQPTDADAGTEGAGSDDAASSDPSSSDVGGDSAEDPSADSADSAGGSTGTRPGRSGSSGTPTTVGGGAGSPGAATPGADEAPAPTTAPFRPDPDRYDTYVGLAREYGGDVASREDATALASVFCSDPAGARAEFLGGEPLGSYPSDLAIVRAYCPDKEPLF
jgi:hypothetical protein